MSDEPQPNDDAPLADEPSTAGVPTDQPPSGLPDVGSPEEGPLGSPQAPEKRGDNPHGADAMPGIPTEAEPPSAG